MFLCISTSTKLSVPSEFLRGVLFKNIDCMKLLVNPPGSCSPSISPSDIRSKIFAKLLLFNESLAVDGVRLPPPPLLPPPPPEPCIKSFFISIKCQ